MAYPEVHSSVFFLVHFKSYNSLSKSYIHYTSSTPSVPQAADGSWIHRFLFLSPSSSCRLLLLFHFLFLILFIVKLINVEKLLSFFTSLLALRSDLWLFGFHLFLFIFWLRGTVVFTHRGILLWAIVWVDSDKESSVLNVFMYISTLFS